MRMKRVDASARIRWYSDTEGGRKTFPTGPTYLGFLNFDGESDFWHVLILLNETFADDKGYQDVKLGFVFRENLGQRLISGRHFFISEGPENIIADGDIISVTAY